MAGSWCLARITSRFAGTLASSAQTRLGAGQHRFFECASGQRRSEEVRGGQDTDPNPTDRSKRGSKHHALVDGNGTPLAVKVTAANRHDVTQVKALVDAIPPVQGKRGRPRRQPKKLLADRADDSEPHRSWLPQRGITPKLAKRRTEHGSGLGKLRWVVERTFAWLHDDRKLRIREERRTDTVQAFLTLAAALICFVKLLVLLFMGSKALRDIDESIQPGTRALILMPCPAHSTLKALVKPMSADFAAE